MVGPKRSTAPKKNGAPFSVGKRHSLPAHERLLLAIQNFLPRLLADELQSAAPLNEYIISKTDNLKARIEELISEKSLKGSEAKIWRGVPSLRLADPELEFPCTVLGATLTKRIENQRSSRVLAPILVADFALRVEIPRWRGFWLRDGKATSYPKEPISKTLDCLSITQSVSNVPVFGQAFPAGCSLGEVAIEMAHLVDAVQLQLTATQEYDFARESHKHVVLVTDSQIIYDALSGQYDAVCFHEDDETVSWDISNLESFHTATGW